MLMARLLTICLVASVVGVARVSSSESVDATELATELASQTGTSLGDALTENLEESVVVSSQDGLLTKSSAAEQAKFKFFKKIGKKIKKAAKKVVKNVGKVVKNVHDAVQCGVDIVKGCINGCDLGDTTVDGVMVSGNNCCCAKDNGTLKTFGEIKADCSGTSDALCKFFMCCAAKLCCSEEQLLQHNSTISDDLTSLLVSSEAVDAQAGWTCW